MGYGSNTSVAVVTGANRGLGYATVLKLCEVYKGTIILTARNALKGRRSIARLRPSKCVPLFHHLDIADQGSCTSFGEHLRKTYGGLDVLVNNAAVRCSAKLPLTKQTSLNLNTNFYGTLCLCRVLFALLRPHARVVNVSSPCGHLSDIKSELLRRIFRDELFNYETLDYFVNGFASAVASDTQDASGYGSDSYCISKFAVTAMTNIQQRQLSATRPGDDIVVNAYSPVNVHSQLNDFNGTYRSAQVAVDIVRLATLPDNVTSPLGQYVWLNMTVVDWNGEKPVY